MILFLNKHPQNSSLTIFAIRFRLHFYKRVEMLAQGFILASFCLAVQGQQQQQFQGQPQQQQQFQGQQQQQFQGQPQQQQQFQGQPQQQFQAQPQQPHQPAQQVQHHQQQQQQQQQRQQPQQHAQPAGGHAHGHGHGGQQQVLHKDMKHEAAHMAEHMEVPIDTSNMSEQELQFHYFKMHDTDGNDKLDGCELVKSLIHWHDSSNHDPKSGTPIPEAKIFKDDELVNMIDPILDSDDRNKDGFIDYPEFVAAQQAATAAAV